MIILSRRHLYRGFKNCAILVCGLLPISTPLSGVFSYHFLVIFDLIILVII